MATFDYIVRQSDGSKLTGHMQADSEAAVARSLDEQGLFPVRISQHAEKSSSLFSSTRATKIKPRAIGAFYGQLADLLVSGVPLMRSLNILTGISSTTALGEVLAQLRDDVSAGQTLAESMGKHPAVFQALHIAMVTAGERAGFLEDALTNLAELIDRQDDLRSKVLGALIYPLLLIGIGMIVLPVLLIFMVPKFKEMFASMVLPAPTEILFAASDLLRNHYGLILGLIALFILCVRAFVRSEYGARLWQYWQLKLPVVGQVIKMLSITRFCRVLGAMLANGVPILEAMDISRDAVASKVIQSKIAAAAESVKQGKSLAEPLSEGGVFPPEIVEMIAVGEEANQLESVLEKTANTFERRTNRTVDAATRLIEPLLLVLLAVSVAFIMLGLLYPIMNMSDAIQ